jgi:hypothetical protein
MIVAKFRADATFTTQQIPGMGDNHVAADLNGDGRLNLAGTGFNAVSVVLKLGTGALWPKNDSSITGS